MKQKQYAPMSVAEMALSIYAVNNGYMDKVDLKKIGAFEAGLQAFAKTNYKQAIDAINANPGALRRERGGAEEDLRRVCNDRNVLRSDSG